jgi:hypothetical protein
MRMHNSKTLGAVMALVLGTAFQAQALTISPSTVDCPSLEPACLLATGNETSQAQIDVALALLGVTNEVYKQNVGGSEEGDAADWYTTTFSNANADALIEWDGPGFLTAPIHLLVKDGNQTPAWYLFAISIWDGKSDIVLQNFWPGNGEISHISLYGGTTSVPDGGSVAMLLGMALMGLAGFRRMLN